MSDPTEARCPKCGSENLSFCYGFAGGGGIGPSTFCLDCDFQISKHVTEPGQCLHEEESNER